MGGEKNVVMKIRKSVMVFLTELDPSDKPWKHKMDDK
jgi:hypothetical protein